MVFWITGKSAAGKTTYAKRLKRQLEVAGASVVLLDGDEVRSYFKGGFEEKEREKNVMTHAYIAAMLEKQGYTVVVAVMSPRKAWRMQARRLFKDSMLIYLPGGTVWEGVEYEEPDQEEIMFGGV